MNPVMEFILTILLVGVLGSIFLAVAWKIFRIAVVAFLVGNVFMYFGLLAVILFDLPEYWRLLTTGDQEAFWVTVYLVVLTFGGLGFLGWNIFDFFTYRFEMPRLFQKNQYAGSTQSQTNQQEERQQHQQQKEQRTYFQEAASTYLRDLELLGLERGSSQDDIKTAYRKLSKKYHPDVNPDPHATIIFKQIQKAYQNLAQ